MEAGATARITERLLRRSGTHAPGPRALTFLLTQCEAAPREALLVAVAALLDPLLHGTTGSTDPREDAAWLTVFALAAHVYSDDRIDQRVSGLAARVRDAWRPTRATADRAVLVDACLLAGAVRGDSLLADAVDELERVVAAAYEPGAGVARFVDDPDAPRGVLADQVAVASALLTAFDATGRLPYSMLAEELVRTARRTLWDERRGAFVAALGAAGDTPFALNCDAARVLCRLAALHARGDYRAAAVVADDADYRADAARTLDALGDPASLQDEPLLAAYGLAVGEWSGWS